MRQALVEADLHFQDWISNSKELAQAMKREKKPIRDKSDLLGTDNDQKKVLGAVWNIREDTLRFRVDHLAEEENTRVSLTSKVAGVFDPLGLAAPLIVKAKVRLRELGVKGLKVSDSADGNRNRLPLVGVMVYDNA